MKCISCSADIPPAWVNAINTNICPGCGGEIMSSQTKELLSELREAMLKMPNDAEGLAGWLLSNYNLEKIGSAEPTNFHRKKQSKPKKQQDQDYDNDEADDELQTGEKIVSDEHVSKFFKGAGVKNNSHLSELAARVKKQNANVMVDSNSIDPDALREMQEELGEVDVAMPETNYDSDADSDMQSVMDALASGASGKEAKDMHLLQKQRMKYLSSQRELSQGGSIGKISRR